MLDPIPPLENNLSLVWLMLGAGLVLGVWCCSLVLGVWLVNALI